MFLAIKAHYTHAVGLSRRLREVKLAGLSSIGYFMPVLISQALIAWTIPSVRTFGMFVSDTWPAPASHAVPNTPTTTSLTLPTTEPPTPRIFLKTPFQILLFLSAWVGQQMAALAGSQLPDVPPPSTQSCEHRPFANPIRNENFPISVFFLKNCSRNIHSTCWLYPAQI